MRKRSRKVFYSSAAMPSTQPRRCLLLGYEEAESESLLLGRGDASYSAMRKPSRKVFHSAKPSGRGGVSLTFYSVKPSRKGENPLTLNSAVPSRRGGLLPLFYSVVPSRRRELLFSLLLSCDEYERRASPSVLPGRVE